MPGTVFISFNLDNHYTRWILLSLPCTEEEVKHMARGGGEGKINCPSPFAYVAALRFEPRSNLKDSKLNH